MITFPVEVAPTPNTDVASTIRRSKQEPMSKISVAWEWLTNRDIYTIGTRIVTRDGVMKPIKRRYNSFSVQEATVWYIAYCTPNRHMVTNIMDKGRYK